MWKSDAKIMALWKCHNEKIVHRIVFCLCLCSVCQPLRTLSDCFVASSGQFGETRFAEKHILWYVQRSCFICDALLLPLRFIVRRRWHGYVTFHCNWIFVDVIWSVGPAGPCMILLHDPLMIVGKCEKWASRKRMHFAYCHLDGRRESRVGRRQWAAVAERVLHQFGIFSYK